MRLSTPLKLRMPPIAQKVCTWMQYKEEPKLGVNRTIRYGERELEALIQ